MNWKNIKKQQEGKEFDFTDGCHPGLWLLCLTAEE